MKNNQQVTSMVGWAAQGFSESSDSPLTLAGQAREQNNLLQAIKHLVSAKAAQGGNALKFDPNEQESWDNFFRKYDGSFLSYLITAERRKCNSTFDLKWLNSKNVLLLESYLYFIKHDQGIFSIECKLMEGRASEEDVLRFIALIKENSTAPALCLRWITMDSAEKEAALIALLNENVNVTKLTISNIEGKAGTHFASFAKALEQNKTLTSLSLEGTNINEEGLKAMGVMLGKNKALAVLDLSSNKISDDVAYVFAAGLKCNDTLKELTLNLTKLSKKGIESIATALGDKARSNNMTLKTLSLLWNDHTAEEAIKKLVTECPGLQLFFSTKKDYEDQAKSCCSEIPDGAYYPHSSFSASSYGLHYS